jgi:hypothetical protein
MKLHKKRKFSAKILILDEDDLVCLSVSSCVFVSKFLPGYLFGGVYPDSGFRAALPDRRMLFNPQTT